MGIRLYPLPTLFDEDVLLVKSATPVLTSSFYLRRPFSVPWSAEPTTFILETDEPDQPHEIVINRTDRTVIIPGVSTSSLALQLAKGANRIDITTPNQRTFFTVAATAVETWFRALGREFYIAVAKRMREIEQQFNTPWTTRVSAHLLPYGDVFLPARMPKIQQTRMAIITSVGGRLGHGDGVLQVASAVSYSTPWVSRPREAEFAIPGLDHQYPGVTSLPTTSEDRAGRTFDLWHANHCLATKQALFQLAVNMSGPDVPEPKPLRLIDVNDYQILLQFMGEPTEVHDLDPGASDCADIEFNASCEAGVRTIASIHDVFEIMMNSPQLALDEVVEAPINFGFWDELNFTDMSEGSGALGLGGGDEFFDTRDPDDPFGTGFLLFPLSRRFDAPACLDTRVQRGTRLVKYVAPLASTSNATPETVQAGSPLRVDAAAGAPAPSIGATVFWGTSPRHYLYEGDWIRFEEPDVERQVLSAWPVFEVGNIVKSTAAATLSATGPLRTVTAPTGFFEARHRGNGIHLAAQVYDGSSLGAALVNGSATVNGIGTSFTVDLSPGDEVRFGDDPTLYTILNIPSNVVMTLTSPFTGTTTTLTAVYTGAENFCIAEVSDDGTLATVTGNSALSAGAVVIVNVYAPVRDRDVILGAPYAGERTYEVTLSSALAATIPDDTILDYRTGVRVDGSYLSTATTVRVSTDAYPFIGDLLFISSSSSVHITMVTDTGLRHPTTTMPIYEVELDDQVGAPLSPNQVLFTIRADPCWENGDPVTPLNIISMSPTAYLTP